MTHVASSPMNRHERIRALRIKIIIHRRIARHNIVSKGLNHHDSVHELGVVEELSSKLSNEMYLHNIELDAQNKRKHDSWDIEIMDVYYDI